jgi:hypothetical protein
MTTVKDCLCGLRVLYIVFTVACGEEVVMFVNASSTLDNVLMYIAGVALMMARTRARSVLTYYWNVCVCSL